jgi:phosphoadenosine phosphosulfate reductase
LQVLQETEHKYGRRIHAAQPASAEVSAHLNENGINGIFQFVEVRKDCCAIRKIRPLKEVLQGAQGWVSGVRAGASAARATTPLREFDASFNIEKLNPLYDFSRERLADYITTHNIPINSLHAQGFPSIGCAPCTRAIAPDEDERAGRWWWENDAAKECGLHVKEAQA